MQTPSTTQYSSSLSQRNHHAYAHVFDDAGHFALDIKADDIAALVDAFIQKLPSKTK